MAMKAKAKGAGTHHKPRREGKRKGNLILLWCCYLGAAVTTTTTTTAFPATVHGFHHHHHRHARSPAGRATRRRSAAAGQALHPPPLPPRPQSLLSTRRSSSTAMSAAGDERQRARGVWGWGPGVMDTGGSGSGGGGGSCRGSCTGKRGAGVWDVAGVDAARGRREGGFWMRLGGGSGSAAAWGRRRLLLPPLRCTASGGGDESEADSFDNNFGSPDYSEYGYEPEYELQGEDGDLNADAETLAKWRLEKLLANDRWQFGKYGTQNVGNWVGSWQEYVAQEVSAGTDNKDDDAESGLGSMIGIVPGKKFVAKTGITRREIESAGNIKVFEHEQGPVAGGEGQGLVGYESAACPPPVVETLFSDSFRGDNGTQVVGNAYTAAEHGAESGSGEDVWVEVGLRARDKHVRVRCVFQYGAGRLFGSEETGGKESSASGRPGSSSMVIRRVFLVREGLDRLPPQDEKSEPELYGAAGKGLYDVPAISRSPLYFSIYAEGGLTLRFPLEVEAGQGGVICVDWTVGSMRYQADRVFDRLDGTVRRLEVTEIGTQDAETYLPMEKF